MDEILRTNDLVLISFVEALLKEAGVRFVVFDQGVSAIEGSIGAIPRRVLVERTDLPRARRILTEAGLGAELRPEPGRARP